MSIAVYYTRFGEKENGWKKGHNSPLAKNSEKRDNRTKSKEGKYAKTGNYTASQAGAIANS